MRRASIPAFPVSLPLCAGMIALFLVGCQDSTLEPDFAKANVRYQLTIRGTGTERGGVVTSDRGGINCAVAANGTTSGKCSQGYKAGAIVTLYLAPASGAKLKWVSGACQPSPENPLACDVQMTVNREVVVQFEPQANIFTLTVSGGAAGSGNVSSSPAGISCSISNGSAASTGCSAPFSLNTSVTLTATASSGSYLKAWAGGGCDTGGNGIGKSSGACTVTVSQTLAVVVSFERPANVALLGEWGSPFTWGNTASLAIHGNVLPNGKVLTWGRSDRLPVLWDPTSNAFGTAPRPVDLFCSGHALLPNGRLLASGGHSGTDNQGIRATSIYDPVTNTWATGLPNMQNGRWYPSVLALPNGEMLTISGGDTAKVLNRIPEVWTTSNTWRALTTAASSVPYYPMLFVAPNGTVFMAGPGQSTGFLNTSGTGSWTAGPPSTNGDRSYGSAVMYEAGKVLLVGGGGPTATAEKIDLNAGTGWTSAGSMSVPRRQINATLLADGTVLVTGGTNATGFNNKPTTDHVLAPERWTPPAGATGAGTWTQLARQTRYRLYHSTAVLLPDGRVLSLGSGQPSATGLSDDFFAELFSPPYLFNLDGSPVSRPAITSAPTSVTYGQVFSVGTSSAGNIAKVNWIRLSAVTHATDMNQRLNRLTFSASGSTLSVTAPANRNLAPPGHYMLFIIDSDGVPSIAKIVQIS